MGLICARLYKSIISDTSTSNMRINFDPQLPHMLCVNMYADVCMHGCVSPTCEVMFLYWWRASKALLRTVLRFCSNASNSSSSWSHCACEYRWVSNQLHCLNPTTQAFSLFPLFGSDEWIEETPQLVHVQEDLCTIMILHEQYWPRPQESLDELTYQDQGAFAYVKWASLNQRRGFQQMMPIK